MSDIDPANYAEFVTEDGPGSRDVREEAAEHERQRRPEQEAHGGSMAPGLVDDTGRQTGDVPPDGSGR